MSANRDVSVVIPTYNGRRFVRETLGSVFAQTLLPREIIVVDDWSTDGTPALVESISLQSPVPVRITRLPKNSGGPSHPMNVGVRAALSPIVALLDQDDTCHPQRLERQVAAIETAPDNGLACGRLVMIDENGNRIEITPFIRRGPELAANKAHLGNDLYWISQENAYVDLLRRRWHVGGASGLAFLKCVWEEVGGFDETLRVAWDYEFALKIAAHRGIIYDDTPIAFHRSHDQNLSWAQSSGQLEVDRTRWHYLRNSTTLMSDSELRSELAKLSLGLAWGYRSRRRYAESVHAYWHHFLYGSRVHAIVGVAKLVVLAIVQAFSGMPAPPTEVLVPLPNKAESTTQSQASA